MSDENIELFGMIENYDLQEEITLLGPRDDIPNVMAALDIHILSSAAESFPNVIAEAMLVGTPCVTTDVGDASLIVGPTGWVVPHSSPKALEAGIIAAMEEWQCSQRWADRRKECRERVASEFSMDRMVRSFLRLWRGSLNG